MIGNITIWIDRRVWLDSCHAHGPMWPLNVHVICRSRINLLTFFLYISYAARFYKTCRPHFGRIHFYIFILLAIKFLVNCWIITCLAFISTTKNCKLNVIIVECMSLLIGLMEKDKIWYYSDCDGIFNFIYIWQWLKHKYDDIRMVVADERILKCKCARTQINRFGCKSIISQLDNHWKDLFTFTWPKMNIGQLETCLEALIKKNLSVSLLVI